MYAFWWDGADHLCAIEKVLCFVQECRQRLDDMAREQTTNVKYAAIDSEKGERDAEDADNACRDEEDEPRQVRVGNWILGHCVGRGHVVLTWGPLLYPPDGGMPWDGTETGTNFNQRA